MDNQESQNKQNPIDFLKIFFRRRWLFITPTFIGLVLGIVACFIMPRSYQASALIMVEEEKIINPMIQGLTVSTSMVDRMQTIKETLLGWNSLVELTKKLNLAQHVQTQAQFEQLIMNLRNSINIQMRGLNIIKIAYTGKNPEETRVITQTLGDILVDENMRKQTKEADVAINFLTEQLQIYKKKIKETEIANLEDQLKTLLVDSTEEHPLVKDLRQQIAKAKKEMDSGDFKVPTLATTSDNPTYQALKKELDKIEDGQIGSAQPAATGSADDTNSTIYKLMVIDKLDSALARDKNVNETIYNLLLQKLETAKITQRLEASKSGTRYTVIDPARLPLVPSKPNKLVVILLGLLLGAASGAGLVFGSEFMDQSFLDIEDAKTTLDLPVLGGISRITTQEEIDLEKYKKSRFITIALIISAVLIVTAILISFFKR
ncbi:MAG TPA: GNVR domain-containing protein [Candidatus Omnitrophota bacterium]|nr:GNVR domain-containing protein [Candidatus Omnitrophota bacterium]